MEAIERFVAEEADAADEVGSPARLGDRLATPAGTFPLMRHATVVESREYAFSAMTNLVDGTEQLAPEQLVRLAPPRSSMVAAPWLTSSNGLASGNHLPESLCAGMYEVIERDAVSLWSSAMSRGHAPLRVDLDHAPGEIVGGLVEQIRSSDSDVTLLWNPTDLGVPTFTAYIWSLNSGIGTYRGYGCHLDPEIAMIRAITEAAQSRAIFIAAARDDMLRGAFEILKRADDVGARSITRRSTLVRLHHIENRATPSFHGDVDVLLGDLQRCGFSAVLARELDATAFEVSVCRVIVPGLETYRFPWSPTSERARVFEPTSML
jgi:ribosomal protein S12 methylthiotransferase accessory factor